MTNLEAAIIQYIKYAGYPYPQCEYRFDKVRRWRFDLAWPEKMIAVEVEGGQFSRGRHTRPAGYAGDCEKYNAATFAGWKVYRFATSQIHSGEAYHMIDKIFMGDGVEVSM